MRKNALIQRGAGGITPQTNAMSHQQAQKEAQLEAEAALWRPDAGFLI